MVVTKSVWFSKSLEALKTVSVKLIRMLKSFVLKKTNKLKSFVLKKSRKTQKKCREDGWLWCRGHEGAPHLFWPW